MSGTRCGRLCIPNAGLFSAVLVLLSTCRELGEVQPGSECGGRQIGRRARDADDAARRAAWHRDTPCHENKTDVNLVKSEGIIATIHHFAHQGHIDLIAIPRELDYPGFIDFALLMPEKNALNVRHRKSAWRAMVPMGSIPRRLRRGT